MTESRHIDPARLAAFLNEKEELTSEEHEHVLHCDDCMEAATNELLTQQERYGTSSE